jgi:hypothetical protein
VHPVVPPELSSIVGRALKAFERPHPSSGWEIAVIANQYERGQGIAPHIDRIHTFGPIVISLSLQTAATFRLTRGQAHVDVILKPGTAVAIRGDARYKWSHEIMPVASERVSLTIRRVVPIKPGNRPQTHSEGRRATLGKGFPRRTKWAEQEMSAEPKYTGNPANPDGAQGQQMGSVLALTAPEVLEFAESPALGVTTEESSVFEFLVTATRRKTPPRSLLDTGANPSF